MKMNAAVQTGQGELRGSLADGVHTFKGIPYAAAPFGAHRFLPPQPVEPWSGVRDALTFGAEPPQLLLAALLHAASFAVKTLHPVCVVAVTCDCMYRDRLLYLRQIVCRQREVIGFQGLGQLIDRRAPTSGTMSEPRERTQAIATWETVAPFVFAKVCSAWTSARLRSRPSP